MLVRFLFQFGVSHKHFFPFSFQIFRGPIDFADIARIPVCRSLRPSLLLLMSLMRFYRLPLLPTVSVRRVAGEPLRSLGPDRAALRRLLSSQHVTTRQLARAASNFSTPLSCLLLFFFHNSIVHHCRRQSQLRSRTATAATVRQRRSVVL